MAQSIHNDPLRPGHFSNGQLKMDGTQLYYEYVMPFGKHKGTPLAELPSEYLKFLAGWSGRKGFKEIDYFLDFMGIAPLPEKEVWPWNKAKPKEEPKEEQREEKNFKDYNDYDYEVEQREMDASGYFDDIGDR